MNKRLLFLSFYLLTYVFAQNTSMPQSVISSGTVNAQSEQTALVGTIGQVFTSKAVSSTSILTSGFWGSVAQITLDVDDVMPEDFSISKAYPNPFNPTVNIDFSISEESDINIQIFDLLGRNVFNHDQNFNTAGKYRFQWHGINDLGTPIASGVYFVTIQHKANIFKQKITFLK
ncbi:MAG: T9SS type A sorting domain-containing protein [Candidatus Marinimicrobia bacterium]|jgi:flagellar hook assembly protein FlgD|nr:T9SS type A sorting domain-containing protein [Candidatus Neomarinimicrobiota bacterium]MBT4555424.1 T9SS type A sorting domain-containing protein [Candidatus Neomarinimicrobiota bacterium]MBT4753288.1 T9SS type A sorting domain-containing protein [Candidatus Neomarinimicrobiota bacterium]MBT6797332.1 T9SS type A sorting domain-containing protein [Candidatus Neomarinimicrobiota bacterium]MBT7944995.1 T9SS type A sorting domain-containing protein [Candidatus Neomarinimicrobiota bacterium]